VKGRISGRYHVSPNEDSGFHPRSRRVESAHVAESLGEIRHMATRIIFGVLGLGAFFALMLRLATYAVPTFAAIATALWTYNSGAGTLAAIVVGIFVGAMALFAGRIALGTTRSNYEQSSL
jgi:hypothetical protein